MVNPALNQVWCLKTDPSKTLRVSYVNSLNIVGYHDAKYMKRDYGTLRLDLFLKRYQPAE